MLIQPTCFRGRGAPLPLRCGVKTLYRRGHPRQDFLELFRFIDWLLELPEGLEDQLWAELKTYEESEKMPYVTSVERIGIHKGEEIGIRKGDEFGLKKGIPRGEALILRRRLTRRFGCLPAWANAEFEGFDRSNVRDPGLALGF